MQKKGTISQQDFRRDSPSRFVYVLVAVGEKKSYDNSKGNKRCRKGEDVHANISKRTIRSKRRESERK